MPNEPVTMKQIAKKAGVSIGTVDRALSNRAGISEKTKEHVLGIAKELGYQRNTMASVLSRKKKRRIGIVFARQPDTFYSYVEQGIERAAKEYKQFGLEIEMLRTETTSPRQQMDLLEQLDIRKYDALAINAAGDHIAEYIDKYVEAGVPVATFNTDCATSRRLFFVGNHGVLAGQMAGELLGKLLNGQGEVAVIGNFLDTASFTERFGGFCRILQLNFPGITIVPCAECSSDIAKAEEVATQLLERNPNLKGLFAATYTATLGTIQAIAQQKQTDVKVVGFDLSEMIEQALVSGQCTATIYQEPLQQGYQAVRLLARYLLEQRAPEQKRYYVESKIILASNARYYLKPSLLSNTLN